MGDRLRTGKPPRNSTKPPGKLSLVPYAGREMSTGPKCGDALRLESNGRMAHSTWERGKRVGGR